MLSSSFFFFFFFNDTATTEIYTLSLHDALPIWLAEAPRALNEPECCSDSSLSVSVVAGRPNSAPSISRSEEHTSELQSQSNLVCRLLLEKKKNEKEVSHLDNHHIRTTLTSIISE